MMIFSDFASGEIILKSRPSIVSARGVAVKMSYHPNVIHLIAGCGNLLMVKAVCDVAGRAVGALVYVFTVEAGAEALLRVELIVVNLGLRMMVRRIA